MSWTDTHVVVGVTGSIAAYKAAYLTRLLVQARAEVQVAMTRGAQQFVGELTFATLTRRACLTDLWSEAAAGRVGHIAAVDWAHAIVIAPATADTLARIAIGRADDP